MLRFLSFLAVVLGAQSASAPFVTPCKVGDNECIKASAQAAVPILAPGIPALGVPSMDPMYLDKVTGDQAGLQLTFTDTTIKGMKGCTVDAIKHDISKGKNVLTIRCSVTLNGDYKLGGQLLVLPIQGEGKYTIKIRDIIIKASSDLVIVTGEDGKPHWHITKAKHSYSVKTGTTFNFENLFNGNKLLAEPVKQFTNSNWKEVMQEIAPPIVKAIVDKVTEGIEAFYKAVPADELFLQ